MVRTKYWVRPITRRMKPDKLYRWCKQYIEFMWPLARLINRIPRLGRSLNLALLIADYRGVYDLSDEMLKEWAILDTFDKLAPAYDDPQTLETMQNWFQQANLVDIQVCYGHNGIEGRGSKPEVSTGNKE